MFCRGRSSSIDGRTIRHCCQPRFRKRIEKGWINTVAGQGKIASVAMIGADATLPSLRPPTIWCGCPSGSQRPVDGQGARLAKAFADRWRIVEMENWDTGVLLNEPARVAHDNPFLHDTAKRSA